MRKIFIRQWIQLSLIWIIIALVPIGRVYLNSGPTDTGFYLLILFLGLLLIPLLIFWIKLLQKKKQGWIKIIVIQLLLSVATALLFRYKSDEGSTAMKTKINFREFQQMPVIKKTGFVLFSGNSYTIFTSLMMLSGLALLIEYNEQLRQKKNKENELKINLAISQIKILQSELQPHFIFNTLHSASSLMEFDVNKAQQLIEQFSVLLRNYLSIINRQFYSFEEEIFFLREYINIQELRHNGKIDVDFKIPPACLTLEIPVILLQPVIENSIKHGWIDRKKTLSIIISAEQSGGSLFINVMDNGIAGSSPTSSGIGIRNLKERLGILYEDLFSFSEGWENGYYTKISIPIKDETNKRFDIGG